MKIIGSFIPKNCPVEGLFLSENSLKKYYMTEQELEAERKLSCEIALKADEEKQPDQAINYRTQPLKVALAWLPIQIPLGWAVWITIEKAWILFR